MKRLAVTTFVVLATLTGVILLWQFRQAVALFLFSLAFAAAVRPAVDSLVHHGVRRPVALPAIYLVAIAVLMATILFVSGPLLRDLQAVADQFVSAYEHLWTEWPRGSSYQQTVVRWLPPPQDFLQLFTPERREAALRTLLGFTLSFFDLVTQLAIVLVMSLYWTVDQARFERLWMSPLPVAQRARARGIWRSIEAGVGGYIRSEILQSYISGWVLGTLYWSMGLPFPALLALFGALAWMIPWIGGLIALIPVLALGWGLHPGLAVLAALFTLTVFVLLEKVVEPRILDRRQYSPLLRLLAIIALVKAIGVLGFIMAPPIAAAVQIYFSHLMRQVPAAAEPLGQPSQEEHLARLVDQFNSLRNRMADLPEGPPAHVVNLADRLARLMGLASAQVQEGVDSGPAPAGPRILPNGT
jgi:putative permease